MKASVLILVLILLAACGKIETANQFNLVRKYESVAVSESDKSSINSLCSVLSQKSIGLDSTIGASYTFSLATKDCESSNLGANQNVVVNSHKDNSNYLFKVGTIPFRFQNIETSNSGLFKEICSNVETLKNPYKDSNGNAVWFSIVNSSSDCPAITGSKCVLFEAGVPRAGSIDTYTITVRDWLSIVIDQNLANRGFYTYRKQQNKSSCTEGKYQEAIAILK